jgi:hypothetical protein
MDTSADDPGAEPTPKKRRRTTDGPVEILRKPVNTLAIVPKSARITPLGRKSYNVLLFEAQEQGLDKDVFRTPLSRVLKGVDFGSNHHDLVKKHLRAMVSTTVEWQSPTTGEGTSWNVSGLLAHAKLTKERNEVWVEWSYAVNLKQELLAPTVFARLRLEVISQLRTHAGIALYEICMRYRDVGRTSRQPWRWWVPVLTGQPESERTAKLEYRIFKRDTLKPAIAEVSALTELDIELVEHKQGRFISEVQFGIRTRKQAALPLNGPEPVDLALIVRAGELGIADEKAEELVSEYGQEAVRAALEALARRAAAAFPEPVRDPYRYLRSLLPGEVSRIERQRTDIDDQRSLAAAEAPAKRHERWQEEWLRRRRQQVVDQLASLSDAEQARLVALLDEDMAQRKVHPSIRKRLATSGWQHPIVQSEMVRFYAEGSIGSDWDRPQPGDLLAVAAELGDGGP